MNMNNEPVAWAIKVGKDLVEIVDEKRDFQELVDFYKMEKWDFETVELYTHPAKTLTPITDEEIKERVKNSINGDWVDGYYDGVRWAEEKLRKAQEK
jgi:hypothetical protein